MRIILIFSFLHLCSLTIIISIAQCEEIRQFCEKDIERFTIADLEKHLDGSPLVALVLPMSHKFYILFKASQSDVTAKLWSGFVQGVDSYETFINNVWPQFYDLLKVKVENMSKLRIPCEEAAKLLLGTSVRRTPELKKTVTALNQCERHSSDCDDWVSTILQHTRVYSGAKRVSQTARVLLEVKDLLGLTGNFDRAANIAHVSCRSSTQNSILQNQ